MHENAFDGDLARRIGVHQFHDASLDLEEPLRHRALADADAAARHVADAGLPDIHDTVTGDARSGIQAEDAQHGGYDNGIPGGPARRAT